MTLATLWPAPAFMVDFQHALAPDAEQLAVPLALFLLFDCALLVWLMARSPVMRQRGRLHSLLNVLLALAFFGTLETCLQVKYHNFMAAEHFEYVADVRLLWRANNGEIPRSKAPGEKRILCLGDSSSSWSVGRNPWHYPFKLQQLLRRRFPSQHVTVVNGAAGGYTTLQGLRLLKLHALAFQPDLITLAFGYHDAHRENVRDQAYFENERLESVRALLFKSQVYLLLRKHVLAWRYRNDPFMDARERPPRVSLPEYEANLQAFFDLARAHGSRLLIINMPVNPQYAVPPFEEVGPYHAVNRRFGATHGVPVVDIQGEWLAHPQDELFDPGNANHMVPKGTERLARHLLDAIVDSHCLPGLAR